MRKIVVKSEKLAKKFDFSLSKLLNNNLNLSDDRKIIRINKLDNANKSIKLFL